LVSQLPSTTKGKTGAKCTACQINTTRLRSRRANGQDGYVVGSEVGPENIREYGRDSQIITDPGDRHDQESGIITPEQSGSDRLLLWAET